MSDSTPTLLANATFLTLDPRRARASSLLVVDGRIAAVDPVELPPGAVKRDLGGSVIVPGLHDAHLHLFWLGEQLLRYVDLAGCRSVDEVVGTLAEQGRKRTDGWILGRGLDQDRLAEKRFPTREELDRVARNRPVVITRVCGHAGVASSAALATVAPETLARGDIQTGLFLETGLWAMLGSIPPLTDEELEQSALLAMNRAASRGLTSVGSMFEEPRQFPALQRLRSRGPLPVRVTAHFPGWAIDHFHQLGLHSGDGDDHLRLGAAKFFSDGTLGARTAHLSAPYADAPDTTGRALHSPDDLLRLFQNAGARGYQVAVHAIGDAALRDCIAALAPLCGTDNPRRHRIEHASLCPDDCLESLARHQIITVVQPQFATSDTWIKSRLGHRARHIYRFGELSRAGIPLALSSDAPVEPVDPAACLLAAIRPPAYSTAAAMAAPDALAAYTLGSAFAEGVEKDRGSFEVGKVADCTALATEVAQRLP